MFVQPVLKTVPVLLVGELARPRQTGRAQDLRKAIQPLHGRRVHRFVVEVFDDQRTPGFEQLEGKGGGPLSAARRGAMSA